tara:strand:+ start:26 stop:295 length:270 start_codon:yes stop_codon:yes gene_type:complete
MNNNIMTKATLDLFTSIRIAYNDMLDNPQQLSMFEVYDDLVDKLVEQTNGECPAELTCPMTFHAVKCKDLDKMTYNQMAEIQGQMAFGN